MWPEDTDKSTSIHFSRGMQSKIVRRNRNNTTISSTSNFEDSEGDDLPKFIGIKSSSRSPLHTPSIAQKLAQFSNGRMEQGSKSKKKINPRSTLAKLYTPGLLISPFVPQHHSTPLQDVQTIDTHHPTCKPEVPVTHIDTLKSEDSSVSFCSKPLLAAPHLTHSTSPFTLNGKRISFPLRSESNQADKNSEGVSGIMEKLISEWNNPVFKSGQEVLLHCDDSSSMLQFFHSIFWLHLPVAVIPSVSSI